MQQLAGFKQQLKDINVTIISKNELLQQQKDRAIARMPKLPPDLFSTGGNRIPIVQLVSKENVIQRADEVLLYHGTDMKSLIDMLEHGVRVNKSYGVLGGGFYVSPSAIEALRWARRGKPIVVLVFAFKQASTAFVCCIPRNAQFQRQCPQDCELYTAYDTVMMHRYPGKYFPHFWQYLIKDQRLFDQGRIYLKKIYILIDPSQRLGGGAAA